MAIESYGETQPSGRVSPPDPDTTCCQGDIAMDDKPRIDIYFCEQCRWLLRAAWYAQELLSTFSGQLGQVALIPASGGRFAVYCNGELVWDRKTHGGFPDAKDLKQAVRDQIDPERDLGHSDR